jgi:hypothetical protein
VLPIKENLIGLVSRSLLRSSLPCFVFRDADTYFNFYNLTFLKNILLKIMLNILYNDKRVIIFCFNKKCNQL